MTSTIRTSVVPFVVEASGSGVAQHLVAQGDNKHEFDTDAYPAFGGKDAAPSPLLYALGALTSCNQVTASIVAKDLGITLGEFTFRIQGDLDTAVFVTGAEGNANFDKVSVEVTVQTDADEEKFSTFVSEVERRCPVSQLYIRSGLEFASNWTRADLA
ncbi:OsmC family protein [Williamsia deligens]|uniref:OsmC family protein n=1 Tax=Williamsia deligens TaxID=321325 RepID=A0ABW3GAB7_9NOCA|nr:OsmC family protein [Williamsia deligens]MCP2196098.1 putative OsmC-related protein [Williamsia deligens]